MSRNREPYVRRVEKIELSEKHFNPRIILAVIFMALAVWMITYGFISLFSGEAGWRKIEAGVELEGNCGADIVFQYNIGAGGVSAGTEYRKLKALYEDAVKDATKIFNNRSFDGVNNLYTLNRSPNTEIIIDGELYKALELLEKYGRREHYLAPVYAEYSNLFFCTDDSESINYDPFENSEVRGYFAEIAAFASDENSVNIELLGDNKAMLFVSDEYLAYSEENAVTDYVDFYWMKNAFIVDYLADILTENGYFYGSLASYDGFVRNLDKASATEYAYNIFDRIGNDVYPAARMNYIGNISLVYMRNYVMNDLDAQHYYETSEGEIRHPYIDVRDGLCKSAVPNLVAYSRTLSCAEVLMNALPAYIAEKFDETLVKSLAENGIEYVFCKNFVINHSDDLVDFAALYDKDGAQYSINQN